MRELPPHHPRVGTCGMGVQALAAARNVHHPRAGTHGREGRALAVKLGVCRRKEERCGDA
eukprot:6399226-Pyramimonas_sp.AAC.1